MEITYGIYLYQNVAALDFTGPYETFDLSCKVAGGKGRVVTIAETMDTITCCNGMQVKPQYTFETAPELDIILLPGADTVEAALSSTKSLEWIREQYTKVQYLTAVCTGTLILQKTGLLKGRKVTTHHMLIDDLKKDKTVTVLPDMRYVRDGNIITSQGISAGIDMSLWLVGQIHNANHSRAVRSLLQYDPAPPYQAHV